MIIGSSVMFFFLRRNQYLAVLERRYRNLKNLVQTNNRNNRGYRKMQVLAGKFGLYFLIINTDKIGIFILIMRSLYI